MRIFYIFFLTLIFLSGCSIDEIPDKYIPKEADKFSRTFISDISKGQFDSCYNKIDKPYQNDSVYIIFQTIYDLLEDKTPKSSRVISAQSSILYSEKKITTYILEYEFKYSDDRFAYYSFQISEEDGTLKIMSFNFLPTYVSLSKINDFSFKNKTFINLLWFILMILVPIFIIVSLVFIVLTPMRLKWLWILFVLIGVCKFQLNWTTGEIGILFINISLLGSGFIKSGIMAPWILSFSLPVGAIIFWFKRSSFIRKHNEILEQNEKEEQEKNSVIVEQHSDPDNKEEINTL